MKNNSVEYQLSLVIDNILNIERKRKWFVESRVRLTY
jgi:hypothetical protein